jgi:two-component system copper resistance phosphate regulon response regulator CusR
VRILIIEDYAPLRESVAKGLRDLGYAVDAAADGTDGLRQAMAHAYDAIVLDLMLPGTDGFEILRALRAAGHAVSVLVLTARDGVADRVTGLDLGADDYLAKPFAFEELAARLRALVRRRYDRADPTIRVADLEIDTRSRRVRRAGELIDLSAREYALLEYLASRAGDVVTRTEIFEHVYAAANEPWSNVLDVYVSHLRRKIDQGRTPKLIHTKRGQGYVLGEEP